MNTPTTATAERHRDAFVKTAPLAYRLIAEHMIIHDLPVWMSADTYPEERVIRLRLIGGEPALHAWLQSLVIHDELNEDVENPFGPMNHQKGVRSTFTVSLPDTGVRFELLAFRVIPDLTLVGGSR